MQKRTSNSFNKADEVKKEEVRPLLQDYVGVGCLWTNPVFDVLSHNYMGKIFEYCNENPDNKL